MNVGNFLTWFVAAVAVAIGLAVGRMVTGRVGLG